MAAGVTQPGGAGTIIYLYDNASAANGLYYTFAEISAAFPVDFIDQGTNQKSYRSLVDLQIGDVGSGTATTTLQDTNVKVDWDSLTSLKFRTTQPTAWFLTLGTKCGSGNQAGGANGCDLTFGADATFRGTTKLYGCKLRKKGAAGRIQYLTGITGSTGELVDCDFQSDLTFNSFVLGTATQKVDNVYNCTFSGPTSAGQPILSSVFVTTMERVLLAAQSNPAFIATNAVDISFKDVVLKGTATAGDLRVNSGAARWSIVRPVWSQTAPVKVTFLTAFSITLANALKEYWLFNVKVVSATGAGLENVPVKLTDTLGNVQVNTTTDSSGRISFGSGLTANGVIVVNHYGTSGTYLQSHRSPFLLEVNTGSSAVVGYSAVRTRFYWPGYETYTTTAGTFEDVNVIVPLQQASGTASVWVEGEQP